MTIARVVDLQRCYSWLSLLSVLPPTHDRWDALYKMSVKAPGWVMLYDFVRVFPEVGRGGSVVRVSQNVHERLLRAGKETRGYRNALNWTKIAHVLDLQQLYSSMASAGTLARNMSYAALRKTVIGQGVEQDESGM